MCHTAVIAGQDSLQSHRTGQFSITSLLLPTTINVDDRTDSPCAWLLACIALQCPSVSVSVPVSVSVWCCMHHIQRNLWYLVSTMHIDVMGFSSSDLITSFPFSFCCLNKSGCSFIMQIQDGPLAGVKGVQTTIGEYTIDDSEPVRQKVCNVSCPLGIV